MLDGQLRILERRVLSSPEDMEARAEVQRELTRRGYGQCDDCGGSIDILVSSVACVTCKGLGALPPGHDRTRLCYLKECKTPIPPAQVAVYCSTRCALDDL